MLKVVRFGNNLKSKPENNFLTNGYVLEIKKENMIYHETKYKTIVCFESPISPSS